MFKMFGQTGLAFLGLSGLSFWTLKIPCELTCQFKGQWGLDDTTRCVLWADNAAKCDWGHGGKLTSKHLREEREGEKSSRNEKKKKRSGEKGHRLAMASCHYWPKLQHALDDYCDIRNIQVLFILTQLRIGYLIIKKWKHYNWVHCK